MRLELNKRKEALHFGFAKACPHLHTQKWPQNRHTGFHGYKDSCIHQKGIVRLLLQMAHDTWLLAQHLYKSSAVHSNELKYELKKCFNIKND